MADVNTTDILSAAYNQAIDTAAPTDQSLNAGAMLPDEPIPDVLTNEVEADAAVVMDMLPKLNAEPAVPANESIFNALGYLRSDLTNQRGMSQSIATEAIALLPNFGQGRPVNFYSRHPSPTGYKMALEEIDAGMQSDLAAQLAAQLNVLHNVVLKTDSYVVEDFDFKRRADQVSMQASILAEFQGTATQNGFQWDDAAYRTATVDGTRTSVPPILAIASKAPASFAAMDDYYLVHLDAPAMLEMMGTYMGRWTQAFDQALTSIASDADVVASEPELVKVFSGATRKTVTIDKIADLFLAAEDKIAPAPEHTTLQWVVNVANAAQQACTETIFARSKSYRAVVEELAKTLGKVADVLLSSDADAVASLGKLVAAFAQVNGELGRAYTEIRRWCINAGIATSYVGVLTGRVAELAWQDINQCRETMQMRESAYLQLKTMYEDLQAPIKTNAV